MADKADNRLVGQNFDAPNEKPPDVKARLNEVQPESQNCPTRNGSVVSDIAPNHRPVKCYRDESLNSSFTDGDDDDVKNDNDDEEEEKSVVDVVPDGGWGWVVCFGSFSINLILDGTLFSFGVLMLALVSDMGEDKATTSWIGSAQMGMHLIMGPAVSVMLQKYNIRQVVVVGSMCSAFAFFVSIFAPNVYVLILTYGVCGGTAFGMVFLPGLIAIVPYFDKKRALATGIATSGSGLGTFFYGWLMDELLEAYHWRGTVLILSGLLLNMIIFGLLFRPLNQKLSKKPHARKNRMQSKDHSTEEHRDDAKCREKLIKHVHSSHTEEYLSSRNGICEVIPELPSPTKTLNGSVCENFTKEKPNSTTTTTNNDAHSSNSIETKPKYMIKPEHTPNSNSHFSCEAKAPAVLGSYEGAELCTNEIQPQDHVGENACAPKYSDVMESPCPNQSNVPVIIKTPPSPAIIVPKRNRYSVDCAEVNTASDGSGDMTSSARNFSEEDLAGKSKQHISQASDSTFTQIMSTNRGEKVDENVNNTAIIVPSCAYENANSCKTIQPDCSPSNAEIPLSGREKTFEEICNCGEEEKDTFFSLHYPNNKTSSLENPSNLDSSSTVNSTINFNSEAIDTQQCLMVETEMKVACDSNLNRNDSKDNDKEFGEGIVTKSTDTTAPTPTTAAQLHESLPQSQQSPPLHLRPFWKVHEPSTGKFTVARIYSSDDHINTGKSGINNNRNSLCDDDTADGSSNNQQHPNRQTSKQQFLSPMAAFEMGKSQTVSLYGINGYRNQHPHHHHGHNNMRRRHHHHHHHHSFYELGGSRVEIVENHNKLLSPNIPRGSSTHLAAYHYFGSMASFGAAVAGKGSAENVHVIRENADTEDATSCLQFLNRWFPTRLLKDPHFLFLLIGFVMWTGQSITMTYLPTYAVSLGIDRSEAAYLISIIGIANVVFRPIAGLITDYMSIPSIWLYFCALLLAAVVNFVIPMCKSYHLLAVCAAVFGLCMAVAVSMRTIVLVDQMGLDALTESFGIVALFQGIAFIIFPPIAGSMIDEFKSSKPTFWMSAAMYTISATMMLGAICLGKSRKRSDIHTVSEIDV